MVKQTECFPSNDRITIGKGDFGTKPDLSKFVGLVGQSDIFRKCPTKNARVPDQMSDKIFPTEEKKSIELGQ